MPFAPFEAPRWKILRARSHIHEIQAETQRWANSRREEEKHGPVWTNIPLAIGDAIHNLRSALDHLACDVVRLNGRNPKGVYFPFGTDPDTLETQIVEKHFDRAPAGAIQLLREQEPWRGGRLVLREIHDLDVKDKHELIIPVMTVTSKAVVKGVPFILPGSHCHNCGQPMETAHYEKPGTPIMMGHIFFDNDETALARKEVFPTLTRLADTVENVRVAFKLLLLPKGADA